MNFHKSHKHIFVSRPTDIWKGGILCYNFNIKQQANFYIIYSDNTQFARFRPIVTWVWFYNCANYVIQTICTRHCGDNFAEKKDKFLFIKMLEVLFKPCETILYIMASCPFKATSPPLCIMSNHMYHHSAFALSRVSSSLKAAVSHKKKTRFDILWLTV